MCTANGIPSFRGRWGVPLAGAIRDQTGSYNSAFLLFMVLLAMSLLLLPAIRHPDRSQAVVVK